MKILFYRGLLTLSCFFTVLSPSLQADEILDSSVNMELLEQAWNIPTGGANNQPYYGLTINGVYFEGERDWNTRWDLIKDQVDFQDKRVLELGCNIGIASVFALKYGLAVTAVGVDRPDSELKSHDAPDLRQAVNFLQAGFGVSFPLVQLDFNQDDYEDILGYDYDVVISMSILKWIEDKERFLTYLSNFDAILYEGHDADETEINRFMLHGFTDYNILGSTHIGVSYPPEQMRTLIYFWKETQSD